MAKQKLQNVYYNANNIKCIVKRDSINESVYGYILMSDFKNIFNKPEKIKEFNLMFPFSSVPNWKFKKGADENGVGGEEYVGIEELTTIDDVQKKYAKDNKITIAGTSDQFNEWLQATTVIKMIVHKVKQSYRTVKEWIME